jgi:hypothetical protein
MRIELDMVLRADMAFHQEYDYGTATDLALKVVSVNPGRVKKTPQRIVARNEPLSFKCASCKEALATFVCSICYWESSKYMFCKTCLGHHKCGKNMALPVVNSPRTSLCGYRG